MQFPAIFRQSEQGIIPVMLLLNAFLKKFQNSMVTGICLFNQYLVTAPLYDNPFGAGISLGQYVRITRWNQNMSLLETPLHQVFLLRHKMSSVC